MTEKEEDEKLGKATIAEGMRTIRAVDARARSCRKPACRRANAEGLRTTARGATVVAVALRESALGHEALKRFVARAPLRRVHECVFAILALASEPIDPRL